MRPPKRLYLQRLYNSLKDNMMKISRYKSLNDLPYFMDRDLFIKWWDDIEVKSTDIVVLKTKLPEIIYLGNELEDTEC